MTNFWAGFMGVIDSREAGSATAAVLIAALTVAGCFLGTWKGMDYLTGKGKK